MDYLELWALQCSSPLSVSPLPHLTSQLQATLPPGLEPKSQLSLVSQEIEITLLFLVFLYDLGWFSKLKRVSSHSQFQIRNALFAYLCGESQRTFLHQYHNRLCLVLLYSLFTWPLVLFCTIFILKKFEVLPLHQTKEQSERYCDFWKGSFPSNRVFLHLSWKTLASLKRQPQQVLLEVGDSLQLLRRRSSPAGVQKLKCFFPFSLYISLKEHCEESFILYSIYFV